MLTEAVTVPREMADGGCGSEECDSGVGEPSTCDHQEGFYEPPTLSSFLPQHGSKQGFLFAPKQMELESPSTYSRS